MVFATEFSHLDKDGNPIDKGKVFSPKEKVFHFNKEKDILEDRNEFIDVNEQVNSCRDMTLQSILNRYLPGEDVPEGAISLQDYEDDLDKMAYFAEAAEEMKEKYNLDVSLSINEVFEEVGKKAKAYKDDLAKQEELKKTGGESNAQIVEESEQKDL